MTTVEIPTAEEAVKLMRDSAAARIEERRKQIANDIKIAVTHGRNFIGLQNDEVTRQIKQELAMKNYRIEVLDDMKVRVSW